MCRVFWFEVVGRDSGRQSVWETVRADLVLAADLFLSFRRSGRGIFVLAGGTLTLRWWTTSIVCEYSYNSVVRRSTRMTKRFVFVRSGIASAARVVDTGGQGLISELDRLS